MKFVKRFVSITVVGIGIFLTGNCSSGSDSTNSANTNMVSNASNENQNIGTANMENANTNLTTTMHNPINKNTLSAALKQRLKNDKEKILSQKDWEGDAFLDLKIGLFYKNDDEFVRDAVCDVTIKMIAPNNERLTAVSQRRLRKNVNHDTKCKSAVSEMLNAALDTEPITPIP